MPSNRLKPRLLHVTIVSSNPETLDGLATYLREAGVAVHGTRRIERCLEMTPPASSAIVFFPDDFSAPSIDLALADLRRRRPTALPVLVTSDPKRFDRLHGNPRGIPLVVAKPAWGWSLLDGIRARLEGRASASENQG
jgi:DNA-binding response OmpR family regulator